MNNNDQVRAFFDERAEHWDEMCVHDPRKVAAIVTLAQVRKNSKLLDVACGTGVLFTELLARNPDKLVGVDLSERMLEMAGHKYHDHRIELHACDIMELEDGGFDTALVYSAYPHFGDKPALAKKLYSLLVPGGRFIVAHSESRKVINGRHSGPHVEDVSDSLRPVKEEISIWENLFDIDITADNEDIYIFSGTKSSRTPTV